jgi:general secretion pathway protein A
MYTSFYNLKENPFNLTPDPRYLYLSPQHSEALNHLIYGINERKGFIVVTGGIGTGKTTICRTLLSTLDRSVDTALIFNSAVSDTELLEAINQELGIIHSLKAETKKYYIDALNKYLLKNFAMGRNTVLLIDEAQNLSMSVLEQIRMLSNLETEKEKLLQIVLMGQPELEDLLGSSSLRQLNERITVRHEIKPLNQDQIKNYIGHRLDIAGNTNGNLQFLDDSFKLLYEYSQGIPRRINAICDRALLIAYSKDEFTIGKKMIKQAVYDIGGSYLTKGQFSVKKINRLLLVLILAIVAAVSTAVAFHWNEVLTFLTTLSPGG